MTAGPAVALPTHDAAAGTGAAFAERLDRLPCGLFHATLIAAVFAGLASTTWIR